MFTKFFGDPDLVGDTRENPGSEPTTSRDTYGHTDKAKPGTDRPQVAGAPHFKSYLLGLLAKIKCSICSYQLNLWYVAHGVTSD